MKTEINVFLDTEFTTLDHRVTPRLISVGCVAEDGREFYGELSDTYQLADCSDFVRSTVLPLLQGGDAKMLEAQCAGRLIQWIEGLGEGEVVLRTDAPRFDFELLVAPMLKFYGWPKNLRPKYGTVHFDRPNQHTRYQAGLTKFWLDKRPFEHHALYDARAMQFAWKYALRKEYKLVDLVVKCDPDAPVSEDVRDWEQARSVGKEDE